MVLYEEYDLEDVNRYILEQTSFVDDAVDSLKGLYGVDWTEYDVAMAVKHINDESFYRALEEIGEGIGIIELYEEVDISRDEVGELKQLGFIKETGNYIPTVKRKRLANLYLDKVSRIDGEDI